MDISEFQSVRQKQDQENLLVKYNTVVPNESMKMSTKNKKREKNQRVFTKYKSEMDMQNSGGLSFV